MLLFFLHFYQKISIWSMSKICIAKIKLTIITHYCIVSFCVCILLMCLYFSGKRTMEQYDGAGRKKIY